MEWYAIYEMPRNSLPILCGMFDTRDDAILWLKTQKPGEYALFTRDDSGWSFVPINHLKS